MSNKAGDKDGISTKVFKTKIAKSVSIYKPGQKTLDNQL